MSKLEVQEHGTADPAFHSLTAQLYGATGREDPVPAEARCVLAVADSKVRARCSLIEAPALHGVRGPSLLIGHYEALDSEAGVLLLRSVCARARERGVRRILGPMNGSTWRRYRLALPARPEDPWGNPPFFLGEPRNPFEYPAHFLAAGLGVVANYETHIEPLGVRDPAALESAHAKLLQRGISVRTLDLNRFEDELELLYDLSVEAFAENLYYSPIDRASFRAQYAALRPLLDPELVFLASDAGGVVAFLLCYADSQLDRPKNERGILAKSTATLTRARGLGIGGYLMGCARRRAESLGFGNFLYPLMHVDNVSMHFAKPGLSQLYRRYALYGWEA